MATLQTAFQKYATNTVNKQIKSSISDVKSAIKKLEKVRKTSIKDKQELLTEVEKYIANLRTCLTELKKLDEVDFSNAKIKHQVAQKDALEQLRNYENAISKYNISVLTLADSLNIDKTSMQALHEACIAPMGVSMWQELLASVSLATTKNFSQGQLAYEENYRKTLSASIGDIAYDMYLPTAQYNPIGGITTQADIEETVKKALDPFIEAQNRIIENAKDFKNQKQGKEQLATKQRLAFLTELSQTIQQQYQTGTITTDSRQKAHKLLQMMEDFNNNLDKAIMVDITLSEGQMTELNREFINCTEKQKQLKDYIEKFDKQILKNSTEKIQSLDSINKAIIDTIESLTTSYLVLMDNNIGDITDLSPVLNSYAKYFSQIGQGGEVTQGIENAMRNTYYNIKLGNTFSSGNLQKAYLGLNTIDRTGYENRFSTYNNGTLRNKIQQGIYLNEQFRNNYKDFGEVGYNGITVQHAQSTLVPIASQSADVHIDLLKNSQQNILLTQKDKETRQHIVNSAKKIVEDIDKLLYSFDSLEEKPKAYEGLKKQKIELEEQIEKIENMSSSFDKLKKFLQTLNSMKNKMIGGLGAIFGAMGIGQLFHPLQMLGEIINQMNEMGRLRYQTSMADFSAGHSMNVGLNEYMSYTLPKYYYDLSYGQIDRTKPLAMYKGLIKNVGGHYGANTTNDLSWMASQIVADSELFDLGDGEIFAFLKTFYKDMGDSATEAMQKLRSLETFAQLYNIPMEKMLSLINGMTEGMRTLGVSSRVVLNSVTGLVRMNKMRIEDAADLVQSTATNADKMSKDWSRSIFWGMMSQINKGEHMDDLFDLVLDGYKSHFADGSVNEKYYDSMMDRLFAESEYFGTRWGNDQDMNDTDMGFHLLDQGYNLKQTAEIIQLKKEGKLDELKKKLKAYDEYKEPLAPAEKTKEFAGQIKTIAEQLAETTKIQATFNSKLNEIAHIIDKKLGPTLEKGRGFIHVMLNKYGNAMAGLIAGVGGFLNSPIGKFVGDSFAKHPFLTMASVMGVYKLGKYGLGQIGKTAKAGKMSLPMFLALGTTGLMSALVANDYLTENLKAEQDVADSGYEDPATVLVRMFNNGTATANIIFDKDTKDAQENLIWRATMGLLLAGFPYLAYRFASRFMRSNPKSARKFNVSQLKKRLEDNLKKPTPKQLKELKQYKEQLKKLQAKRSRRAREKYERLLKAYRKRIAEIIEINQYNAKVRAYNRKAIRTRAERLKRLRKLRRLKRSGKHFKARNRMRSIRGGLKDFGLNVLVSYGIDLLTGENPESVTDEIGDLALDAGAMTVLSRKFGLKGAIAAPFVTAGVKSFFGGQKAEASPLHNDYWPSKPETQGTHNPAETQREEEMLNYQQEMARQMSINGSFYRQSDDWDDISEKIGKSNDELKQEVRESLGRHGIKWDELSDYEKRIWTDSFNKYQEIMGDYLKAIEQATELVLAIKSSTPDSSSWQGGLQSGAELLKKLESFDPEAAQWMKEAAQEFGVPVEDLAVIANIESGMDRNSNASSQGARGMMQLMPETARGLGVNIDDPRDNIRGGAKEYSQLLNHYNGDKAKAFAAYNMGSSALDSIIEEFPNDWYNHIYAETSNYLVKAGLATGTHHNLTLVSGMNSTKSLKTPPSFSGGGGGIRWQSQFENGGSSTWCTSAAFGMLYNSLHGTTYDVNYIHDNIWNGNSHSVDNILSELGLQGSVLYGKAGLDAALQKGTPTYLYFQNDAYNAKVNSGSGTHAVIIQANGQGGFTYYNPARTSESEGVGTISYEELANTISGSTEFLVPDSFNSKFSGKLPQLKPYKPKTIKENFEDSIKAYQKAIGFDGKKTIKGRIINGMYVDPNQKFVSIEDEIKKLKKDYGVSSSDVTAAESEKAVKDATKASLEQAKKVADKNWEDVQAAKEAQGIRINTLVQKVKSLIKKYFDNVEIRSDI